jgi:competence protein ComEC
MEGYTDGVVKPLRSHAPLAVLFGLFCAAIFLAAFSYAEEGDGTLSVSFFDVGQGDAIYIEGPTGIQVLIDGGPDKTVLSELGEAMPFYDRTLDILIATHPDKDHIAGFIDVLDRYEVSYFFEPGIGSDTAAYAALKSAVAQEEGLQKIFPRKGMILELGEGARLEVLFPDRDIFKGETNTMSVIAVLRYGKTCFLFSGDAPKQVERYILALHGANLKCDVLKAGHHGSRTSTSAEFVAAVAPSFAVISAGKDNRYGHPHREVIDIFREAESEILSTADGTVSFTSDGAMLRLRK